MIIAAFMGCGKGEFAKRHSNAIDLPVLPYRHKIDLVAPTPEQSDSKKVDGFDYPEREGWREEYVDAVEEALSDGIDIVCVPTDAQIVRELEARLHQVYLVVPERGLCEEWRARVRGRSDEKYLVERYIDRWDERMDELEGLPCFRRFALGAGEELRDVITPAFVEDDRTYREHLPHMHMEEKTERVSLDFTEEQLTRMYQAAYREGICLQEWMLQALEGYAAQLEEGDLATGGCKSADSAG